MPKKQPTQPRVGRPVSKTPKPQKKYFPVSLPLELVQAMDALTVKGRSDFIEHALMEREDIQAQLQRQQRSKE